MTVIVLVGAPLEAAIEPGVAATLDVVARLSEGQLHGLWNLHLAVLTATPEELVEVLETQLCAVGALVATPVGDDASGVAHG